MRPRPPCLALLSLILACGALAGGCASYISGTVVAPNVADPVSCTGYVFGGDGRPLAPRNDQIVGHFRFKERFWSVLWAVPLGSRQRDISRKLEGEILSRNGNAIVNLQARAADDWYSYETPFPFIVIPNYLVVTIEGDVVRF